MSSYPPGENYPPSAPSTQYSQQSQYGADPYGQQQAGYGANSYGQPPAGYAANPYGQQQAGYPPVNAYGQQLVYAYVPVQISEPGRGQAMAGMILGIIGICLFWEPFFSLPLAIVGIVLSALGRRSVTRKGMATAGLVLSILTIVFSVCLYGFLFSFLIRRY
ncbi:MAG: DUF4190 domain-containing protein [Ktedonobacteraceae bacterium]